MLKNNVQIMTNNALSKSIMKKNVKKYTHTHTHTHTTESLGFTPETNTAL